jgi:pyruvate, water dikinase
MHFPRALTPLTASIEAPAFEQGFATAHTALDLPDRVRVRVEHHHWYQRNEVAPRGVGCRDAPPFRTVLAAVEQVNEELRELGRSPASVDVLARAVELRTRAWELHFLAVIPVAGAANELCDLVEVLLGPKPPAPAPDLLQGFRTRTLERAQGLWELAREVAADPGMLATLEQLPAAAFARWLRRARAPVYSALMRFFNEFGWIQEEPDFRAPPWVHSPRPALRRLRLLAVSLPREPLAAQREAAARRRGAVARTLAACCDESTRRNLKAALEAAQPYVRVLEDHAFYIDQMNTSLMRAPLLAVGAALSDAGRLARPDDVFFLLREELQRPRLELRAAAAARRADWRRWRRRRPPRSLDPIAPDVSVDTAAARFFGAGPLPGGPGLVRGRPASPGVVRGTAHVAAQPETVAAGAVLVCTTANPAWMPVLGRVAAIVTDVGGVLSHVATVARELGVTCVVATGDATSAIPHGALVEVDGSTGVVRVLDRHYSSSG